MLLGNTKRRITNPEKLKPSTSNRVFPGWQRSCASGQRKAMQMSIFPRSGVPCGQATGADCTITPADLTADCNLQWYSNRCKPAIDPAHLNTITSEMINVAKCAGLDWDCSQYDNLCTAIKELVVDGMHDCQTRPYPDASTACSVEQLVLATDAAGCQRISRFSAASALIANVTENSVYAVGQVGVRPSNPGNTDEFYNTPDLTLAIGTPGDPAKIDDNLLTRAVFTLACTTTLNIRFTTAINFNPAQNGGNGAQSRIGWRVDGLITGPLAPATQPFSNFQSNFTETIQIALGAGTHTVETFVLANSNVFPPSQVFIDSQVIGGANSTNISRAF